MDVFFRQYFDRDIISDNFSFVLEGFGQTLLLSVVSAAPRDVVRARAGAASTSPGRRDDAGARPRDRLHRRMRGIPLLLVILLIVGSLPFLDFLPMRLRCPDFFGKPDIFWFGVISIALTYGAYYAEVYRAGLEGVPHGQIEAARSLGMSHAQCDAPRDRPAGDPEGDPADAERLHRTHEGHLAGPGDRLVEVVKAGREVQAETFNSSALTLGALMFIVVTIPLARLVDRLIARQQLAAAGHAIVQEWKQRREGGRADAAPGRGPQELRRPARAARDRPGGGPGGVVCVIGPSGSGKSTLLRCINLLEPPEQGRIYLEGTEITARTAATRLRAAPGRDGVPAVQPVPPHDGRAQRVDRPAHGARTARARKRMPRAAPCWSGWGFRTSCSSIRSGSREASSSASPSRGRLRWTRT